MKILGGGKYLSYLFVILLTFIVSACSQNGAHRGGNVVGEIPKGTKASVNFLNNELVVINKRGERVKPVKDERKGEVIIEGVLRFKKVNPCYMEWCPSGSPCKLYKISDEDCPEK